MHVLHLAVCLEEQEVDHIGEQTIVREHIMDRILAEIGEQARNVKVFLHREDDSCDIGLLVQSDMSDEWSFEPTHYPYTLSDSDIRAYAVLT